MKKKLMWIVREGADLGNGRYLWDLTWRSPTQYGAIGTVGGGYFERNVWHAWWEADSGGAKRFVARDEAARAAKRVNGRVLRFLAS